MAVMSGSKEAVAEIIRLMAKWDGMVIPKFKCESLFGRPSVYDWHNPETAAKRDYFIVRPDPYEWFDPWEGRSMPLAQSPDSIDVLTYAFSTQRVLL